MLGLRRGTVSLSPHDPAWIREGSRIVRTLSALLGRDCVACEHVGSTAVPFISAKPILDVALGVSDLKIADNRRREIEGLGFTFVESQQEGERLFSRRVGNGETVTCHLHVVCHGSPEWRDYLAFRDYLKGRPDVAREYEAKKKELASAYPEDRAAYTAGKAELIGSILSKARAWVWLGKTVTMTVDRPIGTVCDDSAEPYPINFGYLPGVLSPSGEKQSVYLVGVERPVERYTGRVVAALYRENGSPGALVVAPVGQRPHQATIMEQVWFRESPYEHSMEHLYHHSCGMVVYRRRRGRLEFLILQEKRSTVWSIPKGHVERGESEEEAAVREVFEEAGLSAEPIKGFRYHLSYPIPPIYSKTLTVFLAKCDGQVRIREDEIRRYTWVDYRGAQNHFGSRKMMDAIRAASRYVRAMEKEKKNGGEA